MAKSIRSVLSPLLLISYACGLKIAGFPAERPRFWFSLFYILLLWSIYCFFVINKVMSYIPHQSKEYKIYVSLNMFTSLLSMFFGVYYDKLYYWRHIKLFGGHYLSIVCCLLHKKFRNCLKKLDIVDETLRQLGTMTDYQKLSKRIVWIVLGWSIIVLLLNCSDCIRWQDTMAYNVLTSIYITFMLNYCSHSNIIDDLIFANILGYIGLKFDQVNEHLHKLATENVRGIKRAWENPVLHPQQHKFPKVPSSKHMTWIVIHLHLELQRISREINSIFEVQMTCKMVCYFVFIAELLRELFTAIFVRKYITSKRILFTTIIVLWLAWYVSRIFLINYICEKVSAKMKQAGDFISRISYFTYDVEIRENILQFLLQITQAPLKFYGLGLFQFGYKFLYRYSESILTLVIILIQTDRFKHASKNYS